MERQQGDPPGRCAPRRRDCVSHCADALHVQGMSWGMLPLHASSLCAVTYHLFYNAPELSPLVTLQAGLTCFGNCTLAAAAIRLASKYGDEPAAVVSSPSADADSAFLAKGLVTSVAVGAAVKYASLLSDVPFTPSLPLALAIIGAGVAATTMSFAQRSLPKDVDAERDVSG